MTFPNNREEKVLRGSNIHSLFYHEFNNMVVLFLKFSPNKTWELINFHCYEPISINVDGSALIIVHKIIYKY